jgi:hypothetical protein
MSATPCKRACNCPCPLDWWLVVSRRPRRGEVALDVDGGAHCGARGISRIHLIAPTTVYSYARVSGEARRLVHPRWSEGNNRPN